MSSYRILQGDCIEMMKTLHDESVHCCVTSPPYFNLRDYGIEGQIGLESTPEAYIQKLVEVFSEVRRVIREDGTLWVNIGDSYVSHKPRTQATHTQSEGIGSQVEAFSAAQKSVDLRGKGWKNKDLIGIPWMLAFALRADGWYLRQDIIWTKGNTMPEHIEDRCTKSHEYIFLLAKSERYHFDYKAIREPSVSSHGSGNGFKRPSRVSFTNANGTHRGSEEHWKPTEDGLRNKRDVWNVNTKPFKGAHFDTFPIELIEPCILAGCPEGGTVLDPFGGAGTTALTSLKHNRNAVLCELNGEYCEIARKRIEDSISNQLEFQL